MDEADDSLGQRKLLMWIEMLHVSLKLSEVINKLNDVCILVRKGM